MGSRVPPRIVVAVLLIVTKRSGALNVTNVDLISLAAPPGPRCLILSVRYTVNLEVVVAGSITINVRQLFVSYRCTTRSLPLAAVCVRNANTGTLTIDSFVVRRYRASGVVCLTGCAPTIIRRGVDKPTPRQVRS